MTPRPWTRATLGVAAVITLLASLFPVYWMVTTAFKPTPDIQSETPQLWPRAFTTTHFSTAFAADGFWSFWRNSLLVTVGSVLVALVVAALAAFAVARLRWAGRRAFVLVVFAAQMAPWEALLIPMYVVVRDAGALDQLSTLLVIYVVITLPFTVLTLRGFLEAIPVELEEAARVDGSGPVRTFLQIILPLSKSAVAVLAVFTFLSFWNSYLWPLIVTVDYAQLGTLPVGLASFSGLTGTRWDLQMAAAIISMIPTTILVIVLQKHLVKGIAMAGLGGR
jgi:N,N'-diacetylchitobiose transport system permease protein